MEMKWRTIYQRSTFICSTTCILNPGFYDNYPHSASLKQATFLGSDLTNDYLQVIAFLVIILTACSVLTPYFL